MNMKQTTIRNIALTGLFIALGIALPMTIAHIPQSGQIFLPMHIPVLLCGLICGWQYGMFCGPATVGLSMLFTNMPPVYFAIPMFFELAVYGLIAGLVIKIINGIHKEPKGVIQKLDCVLALVAAMLCGRIVLGAAIVVVDMIGVAHPFGGVPYTFAAFITGTFVTALPGLAIQLVLIPTIMLALQKAGLLSKK
ncbi:MAG: ECF transporter S component [Oscillospiraceae bacterium]|nr:ECF transporter S component [Oscillospiraceae bacterium]